MQISDQKKGMLVAFAAVIFITPDSLFIRLASISSWNLIFYRGFCILVHFTGRNMAKLDYAVRRYGLRETRRSAEAGCVLARRLASARGPPASQARAVRSNKGKNKPIIRTTPPPPPPPHSPGGGCPKNGDMYTTLASCATLGFMRALGGVSPRCPLAASYDSASRSFDVLHRAPRRAGASGRP